MDIASEDLSVLYSPLILGLLVGSTVLCVLTTAGSLKLSFALVANRTPSYFGALGYVFVIFLVQVAAAAGSIFLAMLKIPIAGLCLQVIAPIVTVMVLGQCGFFRSFFAWLLHNVISGVAAVIIVLGAGFVAMGSLTEEELAQLATLAERSGSQFESLQESSLAAETDAKSSTSDSLWGLSEMFFKAEDPSEPSVEAQPVKNPISKPELPKFSRPIYVDEDRASINPFVK